MGWIGKGFRGKGRGIRKGAQGGMGLRILLIEGVWHMKKRVIKIDMVNRKSYTRLGCYSPSCMATASEKNKHDKNAKNQSPLL